MALSDYTDLINQKAAQYGVDPSLLTAMIQQESGGNPNAVGPKTPYGQARGLAGILDSTAQANNIDATKPDQSIDFLARTMAANLKKTGDVRMALKLYQGGPDPSKWGQNNAAYPDQVLSHYSKTSFSNEDSDYKDWISRMQNPAPTPQSPNNADYNDWLTKMGGPTHAALIGGKGTAAAPAPTLTGYATDVARSLPGGVAKGVAAVAGMPRDIRTLATQGATALGNLYSPQAGATAGDIVGNAFQALPFGLGNASMPSSAQVNELLSAPTGGYYQPKTLPGKIAETGASFLPAAIGGEGSLVTRALTRAAIPGATSAAGGEYGGPTGAFLGALAPAGFVGGARALLGTGAMNPARAALAQEAINQGINLRGSQITQSPIMKMFDSAVGRVPFSGLGGQNAEQMTQFTRAVARTFGENADNLTPKVMKAAKDRIGGTFNTVGLKTTIDSASANTLANDLADIQGEASQVLGADNIKPIENQLDNLLSAVDPKTGAISGKTYKALTAEDAPLDRGMNSADPNVRFYVGKIRNALDDALQRSALPEDQAALRQARLQYKNLMTVKDIASKAGIEGEITPSALLGAVRKSYKNMAFTGAGTIGHLADIGQEFLKETPSSTSAERLTLLKALETGGLMGGAALGVINPEQFLHEAGIAGSIIGGARLAGMGLKSQAYRNALLRAAANGPAPSSAIPVGLLAAHNLLNPNVNYGQ